jgi:hypothetical protein
VKRVVVDNGPGANGIIAIDLAARSPVDGYTLLPRREYIYCDIHRGATAVPERRARRHLGLRPI